MIACRSSSLDIEMEMKQSAGLRPKTVGTDEVPGMYQVRTDSSAFFVADGSATSRCCVLSSLLVVALRERSFSIFLCGLAKV